MAVTLKEIAGIANVSINTVSRALKDMPDIGEKTRKKIKAIAEELGYRPNINAQSLVGKKSRVIGLAVTESANPVRMEFCERFRALAAKSGYRTMLVGIDDWARPESNDLISELISRGVDALVLGLVYGDIRALPARKILDYCRRNGLPAVTFSECDHDLCDNVRTDFFNAGRVVAAHLLDQGRKPVFFGLSMEDARVAGALAEAGRRGLEAELFPLKGVRHQDGADAVAAFLRRDKKLPEAIIAQNDVVAVGVLAALNKLGGKEKTLVASFDNTDICRFLSPELTSAGLESDLASVIWPLLEERLEAAPGHAFRAVRIKHKLHIRDSSKPAK